MACYFGCSTGANKCAYFWYFALLISGVGCLVGWYLKSDDCIQQTDACLVENQVTSDGFLSNFDPKVVWDNFSSGLDANSVCQTAFPQAPPGSQQLEGCITCYNEVKPCFATTLGIFIAGVCLIGASFFMFLFCCCCSSPPHNKYYA